MDQQRFKERLCHITRVSFVLTLAEENLLLLLGHDDCGLLQTVFGEEEIKQVAARIELLRRIDLIGREMANAITDIESSIILTMAHPLA